MTEKSSDYCGGFKTALAEQGQYQEIPLAAVDLGDRTLVVSSAFDFGPLLASIREVGLLAPPWLRPRADGTWQVVTGLKRLLAASHLGWERIPARVLPAETPDSHCLLVALYDNSFARGFNLLEQAIFAVRLLQHWERPVVVSKFLPCLGLPPSQAFLARLLALSSLEPPFLQLAAEGRLALTAGALLAEWAPEDRAAALTFLGELWLSQSKQEQFLDDVALLARREAVSPRAILARTEFQHLLHDPSLNPQERTAAVRRQLERWVYPRLSAAREAWQQGLGRLGLANHPRLRLKPPPAFEGPDFHLGIKFRDGSELENLMKELNRLIGEAEFTKLTSL